MAQIIDKKSARYYDYGWKDSFIFEFQNKRLHTFILVYSILFNTFWVM